MAFPPEHLTDHEDLVLDLRPHWIALARPTLLLTAAIVFGIVVGLFQGGDTSSADQAVLTLALVLIVLALLWFGLRLLGWSMTYFVLTTDRIITRRGVLTKSGIEIPLERVNTVFFNQRLVERMVGAGDLAVESASERGTEHFSNVRKPSVVQREIYVQMEANENRKFDRVNRPVGALSNAEQLEKLHDLLNKGALTEAQFEAERSRLLGG